MTSRGLHEYLGVCKVMWVQKVVYWWNEWVQIKSMNKDVKKHIKLYLYGDTNVDT